MRTKIAIQDLQKGMYVSELDRPWIETPFLFQGFELSSDQQLDELRKHCSYVYIDTEQGIDIPPQLRRAAATRTEALQQQERFNAREFSKLTEQASPGGKQAAQRFYQDKTTLEKEMVRAKEIDVNAREVMQETLDDVHQGKAIDIERSRRVVNGMVDSVIRNPDALICLSQLKDVSLYTALHSVRAAILAVSFGRHLVLSKDELQELGLGAYLHDIGMAKMPQGLLDKPGALTQQEFELMQTHVPRGVAMLKDSGFGDGVLKYVAHHHERHDGSGYPNALKGKAVSLYGAIGAIVDVYDALTSQTAYRESLSAEEVLKKMYEWRQKDFDSQLVEEFIKCMGIFPIGSLVELNTGAIGVVISINRARRLKPKVALVLTADKAHYSRQMICDLAAEEDATVGEIKIKKVLPSGTHDINPMDHIVIL